MRQVSKEKADAIRDKALAVVEARGDRPAAQAAWDRVRIDPRCHGKTKRAARVAVLKALADGLPVAAAEKAGWAVLES